MMGVREAIQRQPGQMAMLAMIIIAITAVVLFFRNTDHEDNAGTALPAQSFYTIDDGNTYFAGPRRIAPFEHNGKQAVQAFVFDFDGKKIVSYMMRCTPAGAAKLAKAGNAPPGPAGPQPGDYEVKRPGEAAWVSVADPKSMGIMIAQAPGGGSAIGKFVQP